MDGTVGVSSFLVSNLLEGIRCLHETAYIHGTLPYPQGAVNVRKETFVWQMVPMHNRSSRVELGLLTDARVVCRQLGLLTDSE